MYDKLKISARQHTGRLRAHEHTSYLPLALLILMAGVVLSLFSFNSLVDAGHPPPQAGSVGLTGTMPSKPPSTAATITNPHDGQHFTASPISVSGTCPDNTLVEIFKNAIFAGSTNCDSGKFSLSVDLLYGKNSLTAVVFDALNQAGPTSSAVTVFYDVSPPQPSPASFLDLIGAQFIIDSDAVYRGTFPGQTLNVPITLLGGNPPFAITVTWGDGQTSTIPRADNSVFNAPHVYKKGGTYEIRIQGVDSKQRVAFLQVAAIINGQPAAVAASTSGKSPTSLLMILWPIFAIAVTMVVSFWMGERREKRLLGAVAAQAYPSLGVAAQSHP